MGFHMVEHRCINCNAPDAKPYDMLIRSNSHEDVYLCDTCHEAIQEEKAREA